KSPVLADRAARVEPELVTLERRRRADIEKVARVHGAVAKELEPGAVGLVRAGFGDDTNHTAHCATVVSRKRVRDDAEFPDHVDAERRIRRRRYRDAGVTAHVGAVEEIAVGAAVGAIDVDLLSAAREAAGVAHAEGGDPGLEERELDEIAAVQWQLFDRLFVV